MTESRIHLLGRCNESRIRVSATLDSHDFAKMEDLIKLYPASYDRSTALSTGFSLLLRIIEQTAVKPEDIPHLLGMCDGRESLTRFSDHWTKETLFEIALKEELHTDSLTFWLQRGRDGYNALTKDAEELEAVLLKRIGQRVRETA